MTTLTEFQAEIKKGERGVFEDAPNNKGATRAMFGTMATALRNALWTNPGLKKDALELAKRAEWLAYDPDSPYPEFGY